MDFNFTTLWHICTMRKAGEMRQHQPEQNSTWQHDTYFLSWWHTIHPDNGSLSFTESYTLVWEQCVRRANRLNHISDWWSYLTGNAEKKLIIFRCFIDWLINPTLWPLFLCFQSVTVINKVDVIWYETLVSDQFSVTSRFAYVWLKYGLVLRMNMTAYVIYLYLAPEITAK